ncbi:hypothetical protein [Gemmobacter sp.]|uniref:hypothetical protein n=1 Tax=Gemmobacter sp. TaxID=1898957 RepID=UPI002AFFAEF7|nr:hypothetical protein [Gemmobacter sp.]
MKRFCSACGGRLPDHAKHCDGQDDEDDFVDLASEEWQMLAAGGLDLRVDELEATLVAAGANALAVVVFAHGEQWVRLGGVWNSAVLGVAVEAMVDGMDPALILPQPTRRLDA